MWSKMSVGLLRTDLALMMRNDAVVSVKYRLDVLTVTSAKQQLCQIRATYRKIAMLQSSIKNGVGLALMLKWSGFSSHV